MDDRNLESAGVRVSALDHHRPNPKTLCGEMSGLDSCLHGLAIEIDDDLATRIDQTAL